MSSFIHGTMAKGCAHRSFASAPKCTIESGKVPVMPYTSWSQIRSTMPMPEASSESGRSAWQRTPSHAQQLEGSVTFHSIRDPPLRQ